MIRRASCLVALLALVSATQTEAAVVAPAYSSSYTVSDLGPVFGEVSGGYGGLTFKAGDPNTILIGIGGGIFSVGVARNGSNHITGFSSVAAPFASSPNID